MFIEILLVLPVVGDIFDIVSNTFYLQSPELTNIGQLLRSQLGYKTRSPTLKRFKSYIVDLKAMENTTKTDVIKTHFGYWDVPLSTNTVASEDTITNVEWITFSIILLLDM